MCVLIFKNPFFPLSALFRITLPVFRIYSQVWPPCVLSLLMQMVRSFTWVKPFILSSFSFSILVSSASSSLGRSTRCQSGSACRGNREGNNGLIPDSENILPRRRIRTRSQDYFRDGWLLQKSRDVGPGRQDSGWGSDGDCLWGQRGPRGQQS